MAQDTQTEIKSTVGASSAESAVLTDGLGCDFHEPFFGASYPDACCIDGYLWDLDSGEGDGYLTHGGDVPCPKCNKSEYDEYIREDA